MPFVDNPPTGRRKAAKYFGQYTWAQPEKLKAVGDVERGELADQLKRLRDFKRKLADTDQRLPEAKRLHQVTKDIGGKY